MNAGLHELPLVFFTVLAQSAVGAWLIFTFVLLGEKNEKSLTYIHKAMFVILVILGLCFIASVIISEHRCAHLIHLIVSVNRR